MNLSRREFFPALAGLIGVAKGVGGNHKYNCTGTGLMGAALCTNKVRTEGELCSRCLKGENGMGAPSEINTELIKGKKTKNTKLKPDSVHYIELNQYKQCVDIQFKTPLFDSNIEYGDILNIFISEQPGIGVTGIYEVAGVEDDFIKNEQWISAYRLELYYPDTRRTIEQSRYHAFKSASFSGDICKKILTGEIGVEEVQKRIFS